MKTPNQLREDWKVKSEEFDGEFLWSDIENYWLDIIHQRDEELVSEIEKMKLENTKEETDTDWFYGYGFNNSIDQIVAHIRSKREEYEAM